VRPRSNRLSPLLGLATWAGILITLACSGAEPFTLNQPMEMGPWKFAVTRADERTDQRGGGRWKTITLSLRLENYRERQEQSFEDFLNGSQPNSIMSHPHMTLADAEGNRFDGIVRAVSGDLWMAEFLLVPDTGHLLSDPKKLAEQQLGKHPGDFRLVIENPDHRSGQARRVEIARLQ
jgi:hypothetical protein